jgi:hypothetical protein
VRKLQIKLNVLLIMAAGFAVVTSAAALYGTGAMKRYHEELDGLLLTPPTPALPGDPPEGEEESNAIH